MHVFVYGTLTDPGRVETVLDEYAFRGRATLQGLHRVEGRYPTLAPGGAVEGRVLETPEIAALDRYEGVEDGLYCRVSVPVTDAPAAPIDDTTVAVYVGDPDRLDAPADWPGSGPLERRVQQYLSEHEVSFK
jgi:gamma-glutamylcyclotransferase (GGCT)/AIG2-like uncharacterized protein YtfP